MGYGATSTRWVQGNAPGKHFDYLGRQKARKCIQNVAFLLTSRFVCQCSYHLLQALSLLKIYLKLLINQQWEGGGGLLHPHTIRSVQPGAVPCLHSLNATYAVSFTFDSKTKISLRGYTERRKRFFLGLNDIP
jgi:hypothetical protein